SIRFPPANGLAGSAVWQPAQSPASTRALPRAMVSCNGSLAAVSVTALHNARQRTTGQARIARIARYSPCDQPRGPAMRAGQLMACYVISRRRGYGDTIEIR